MAMVLDAFVCKLAGILAGMAIEEMERLLGVPGEIIKLEMTLGDLRRILGDAETRRIHDSTTEGWVRDLRNVMYDADNILDLCQIMEGGGGGDPSLPRAAPKSSSGCWNIPMLSCFRNPAVAHDIGKMIQALNQQLLDIERRSSRFSFIRQAINSSLSYSADRAESSCLDSNRKTAPGMVRSDVVGRKIEQDTAKIVNLLVNKDGARAGSDTDNVVVVAITGTGGIGKTTLCRMVFNSNMVEEYFDKKIWLSVNKEFNEIAVIQSLISAFGGNHNGSMVDKALLEDALKRAVWQKKFLLVLDDVWSDKVWNKLLRVPLNDGASGSRVLVTTRNRGVAHEMRANHFHQVSKLSLEDAWSLLKKQVVLNESDASEVDALADIGMNLVRRCDGLPLAVKVVGGFLRKKSIKRGAWMDVLGSNAWSIEINDDLNKAVYVSYEELPPHLKQCLLYCSLLPKDETIIGPVIVRMWIAEGFVQSSSSSNLLEELGVEYYRELISRNLIEPDGKHHDQLGCTMHDIVRSFAQYVAKDEGLLVSEGQNLSNTLGNSKLRHLSLSRDVAELGAPQTQVSLRTLLLFKSTTVMLKDFLDNFRCLRVLHVSDVTLVELPESICHLKHLRYLGLGGTGISTIPQGIGDLKFLQVIDLEGCANFSQLPNSILKLQKLRFISFNGTKITSIPRGFGKLKGLVKLLGFPTYSDDSTDGWWSLEELGSLSELTSLHIEGLEKAPFGYVAAKAKISSKPRLGVLDLTFSSKTADNGEVEEHISKEQERIEDVLCNLCPPPSIERLKINGYFGLCLPNWMRKMPDFESLRLLELSDYIYCAQLPNGLGQLPFLDHLFVECAPSIKRIGHDFLIPFSGADGIGMEKTSASGARAIVDSGKRHHLSRVAGVAFPKLAYLSFTGMLGWSEWEWEEQVQAMPALQNLWIGNCKLSHLPPGLAYHARQLRMLDLKNMSHLVCVENFPSLVALWLSDNPRLEKVTSNKSLQHIYITRCPRVKVLEELPSLGSIDWKDLAAEALPDYLREAKLNKLRIDCGVSLLKMISLQDSTSDSEWGKIQHVKQLKAYGWASEEDQVDRHIYYTKEPYSFDGNIGEKCDPRG